MEGVVLLAQALIGAIPCAFIGYFIGKCRNRARQGFYLGLFLGPLGWLIAACLSTKKNSKCPYCKEPIEDGALICPHCRTDFRPKPLAPNARTLSQFSDLENGSGFGGGNFAKRTGAPAAGKKIQLAAFCPHCQAEYEIEASDIGSTVACESCGKPFIVKSEH